MAETCICSYQGGKMIRFSKCPIHGDLSVAKPEDPGEDALLELQAVRNVVKELTAKVQLLVDLLDQKDMLIEHAYTFPDGDVWKAQDIEP